MRHVVKNITFKVPNSKFVNSGVFITPVNTKDSNIRSLLRWNPLLNKAEYKIKLINSHTREIMRHDLTRVELSPDRQWVLIYWNPDESFDAIINALPSAMVVSTLMTQLIAHSTNNNSQNKAEDKK